jgi:hypothetical protein
VVVGPAEGINEEVAAGGWNGAGVGLVEEGGGSGLTMMSFILLYWSWSFDTHRI